MQALDPPQPRRQSTKPWSLVPLSRRPPGRNLGIRYSLGTLKPPPSGEGGDGATGGTTTCQHQQRSCRKADLLPLRLPPCEFLSSRYNCPLEGPLPDHRWMSAREVFGHNQLVKILVILNPTSYMFDIFRFCFIHLRYTPWIPPKEFPQVLNFQPVISRTQPLHLQLTAGSSRT